LRIVTRPAVMRELSRRAGRSGETIGFVPTMGALHDGHLSLMRRARRENGRLAVSVFVNPLQFSPDEDYERYPRNEVQDVRLCRYAGSDWLFMPQARTLYPPDFATSVVPGPMGNLWEGTVRPGHFTGVLTVVLKLLEIVRPDTLYLGQKDAQQVAVVSAMLRDLDLPTRIAVHPTVRERDGLAMSSRNMYLDPGERARAAGLARALRAGKRAVREGRRDARSILAEIRRTLLAEARPDSVEYIALVDPRTFEPVSRLVGRSLLIAAIRVGRTRLIDNMPVAPARKES
jgi:pantoate--beta-alanine ligase